MRIVKKEDIAHPLQNPGGEIIYEMIGRSQESGSTVHHSFVYVEIPSGRSSANHYHKISEETYYIIKGTARLILDKHEFNLFPGQACLIKPFEEHKIMNDNEETLEFLAVSAPAWTPDDTYFLE